MVTNPNTLGIFEPEIQEIAAALHERGAMLYLDGANMNALLGVAKPGDMGADMVQINLHKTFSTPHGGGGPGAGPVAVKQHLEPFLPHPRIVKRPASGTSVWEFDHDRPALDRPAALVFRELRDAGARLHLHSGDGRRRTRGRRAATQF